MNAKSLLGFVLLFIFEHTAFSQKNSFPTPLSPRIANYDIKVTLDPEEKMLHGLETLFWKNPSGDTIRELQFHLYFNAYRNSQSSFMKETGGASSWVSEESINDCRWGWSHINQIVDEAGNDLTESIRFIQPDDDNEEDMTVISVQLENPVMPYDSARWEIDFSAKIQQVMARTGYSQDYFFLAQWFPKLGVYEPAGMRNSENGQWNCHQFHWHCEFYADFGVYDVHITVPENYTVGSSGTIQSIMEKEGQKTHYYRAEDVIDFTWTASPNFLIFEDEWEGVDLKLMTFEGHESFVDNYFGAAKNSLEYLGKHLEKYPYPNLTIVDPPFYGIRTAGMEYPTLITGGAISGLPKGIPFAETFAVHEFTHQYFMQMVATNEMEEAWMDEGLTTYWEGRIMNEYYGENTSTFDVLGIQVGNKENYRISYLSLDHPKIMHNDTPGWEFYHGGYGAITYNKTGTWLTTLERLVGLEVMDDIMKTYFQKWKFKHPGGKDFIAVVNEVVKKHHGDRFGENMDWFFNQVLYGTDMCEYEVASISNTKIETRIGVFEDITDCEMPSKEGGEEEAIYNSQVVLYRTGEVIFPQEILIHFDNGEQVLEFWDGKARSFDFQYEGSAKIDWVQLDPEQKIFMDKNFINNSLAVEPKKAGIKKVFASFLTWMQNAMQSVAMLV